MNKKKYFIISSILLTFILAFVIFSKDNFDISKKTVDSYLENNDDKKSKNQIIKKLSKSIGKKVDKNELSLNIEDSFFILSTLDRRTYVISYKEDGNKYRFIGLVDSFVDVVELSLLPLKVSNENIILIKEHIDELSSSFEEGIYLRGYINSGQKFVQVLSIVESYKAYSDANFRTNNAKNPHWQRIMDMASIQWKNESLPVVDVIKNQTFALSENKYEPYLPADVNFKDVATRKIETSYNWSQKFRHFILYEGKDIKNNLDVAILEDLSSSPFSLSLDFSERSQKYLVKYKNGEIKIVDKSIIKVAEQGISIK